MTALRRHHEKEREGQMDWNINSDAHMTAVLVNKQKVKTTFGYNSINETDVKAVLTAMAELDEKK